MQAEAKLLAVFPLKAINFLEYFVETKMFLKVSVCK